MLRYAKLVLLLAVPACASGQRTDTAAAPAPALGAMRHGEMAGHPMHPAAPPHTRIVVNALGTASRPPEQAVVSLAVETAARTAREAAEQNAQRMNQIIAALRRLDIPEDQIRTTAYNMYPEYRHWDGRDPEQAGRQPEIIGYRVMNMLTVTVDGAARAGAVIDAALAAGANRVDGLSFQLRDTDAVRADALREAMGKARAEAALLADAAGLTLGAPIEISTSYGYMPPPPMPMMARDMAQAAPTPVQPGAVEVQATVSVVYSAHP
ncbi:MAG TPA: SIMPL domain-containing protein [Longimicrobiales bacterium]|nr:SIMPL domain-containing protein [Longimicrobiales bacterium]